MPSGTGPLIGRTKDTLAFARSPLDPGRGTRVLMELLGHPTIRMTADTYGHAFPSRARNAASGIDRALGHKKGKAKP